MVLGHIQRGGTPTAFDRWLATRFGLQAIDAVADGDFGTMMALRGTRIDRVPLIEGTGELKLVSPRGVRRGAGLLRLTPTPRACEGRLPFGPAVAGVQSVATRSSPDSGRRLTDDAARTDQETRTSTAPSPTSSG